MSEAALSDSQSEDLDFDLMSSDDGPHDETPADRSSSDLRHRRAIENYWELKRLRQELGDFSWDGEVDDFAESGRL